MNAFRTHKLPLQVSDLRGLSRLGFDAALALTDVVESMHHTIASRAAALGPAPGPRTSGVTGAVYRAVRGTTRLVGRGVDGALALLRSAASGAASTPEHDAALAAVNGLWGDHLESTGNPLALPMSWRSAGRALDLDDPRWGASLAAPTSRLLVLVHGLCMSDRQWTRRGHDHGLALAHDLGYTPVYLSYNSGRHVSQNGRDMAVMLERLVRAWPQRLDELAIVGHSMGGLLARSACALAERDALAWRKRLTRLVFLGTPHHGAPLERGGRLIDSVLGLSPYVAPLARLSKARSAGITDLRYGNLQDADWQGRDRHDQRHDDRVPTALPAGVRVCLVAATLAERVGRVHGALIADGLVPVASALGEHRDPALALHVPSADRHVVTACGHLDLLCDPRVYAHLQAALRPARTRAAAG